MRNFRNLSIWLKSHLFTLKIYSITKKYPKEEVFGLISQMRRSASSIPTNIAEGCGRNSNPDFKRFLTIASGSSSELEYQLILSKDLEYISEPVFKELETNLIEIRKMIHSFIKNVP
ncbi:MAG: four helix bundle protein [Ginsengibacter sp.]